MKVKKFVAILMAALMVFAVVGCGEKKTTGKVDFKVGLWPDETKKDEVAVMNGYREEFMAQNPDVNIIPDTYAYDPQTFTAKAAAKQLPNLYVTYFTEIAQNINNGYCADLTEMFKKYGFDKQMNPTLLEVCKKDGKIYAIPQTAYAQGLYINKKLFKDAGLVNADGSIKIPNTYQDILDYGKIINEKTGKAGFVIPTINNCGGWHFLNIAWAYGTEFEKQKSDGKWEATFDTQATKDALQWVKDLKWKYNAAVKETSLDQAEIYKQFALGNAAMMFSNPPCNNLVTQYGMNKDDIMVTAMPEGPAGRFSQMGGGVYMFSPDCTKEQLDAGFRWLKFRGYNPELSEEQKQKSIDNFELQKNNGYIILDEDPFALWISGEGVDFTNKLRKEYMNVSHDDYAGYYDFSKVTINPEPSACAQQLYSVLDKCIQEVMTNENADVDALIRDANVSFQKNYLDKMD